MVRKKEADAETPQVEQEDTPEQETAEQQGTEIPVGDGEGPEELTAEQKLQQRVEELEDKLLRSAAEFDNYKKRIARQYEDMVRSSNDALIGEFLEIVDNFERALNHTENGADSEALRKGTELILNQMRNLLKKYDITPIEAIGQPFDPNLHDALMQIDSAEHDEGIVAIEMAKGYRQGNRVIRHSKVGVSKGKDDNIDKQ